MPNEFWPTTPMPPVLVGLFGNAIQQKTAANNPDVFCQSQGSGYRLPSIGEFHGQVKNLSPGSSMQPQSPGHWSQYVGNDITKTRLTNDSTRSISGSLYNEWGDVSKYSNGWEVGNYWSTEINAVSNTRYSNLPDWRYGGSYGRIQFISTGTTTFGVTYNGKINSDRVTDINTLKNVACVRDLVPTPSTLTPSKS